MLLAWFYYVEAIFNFKMAAIKCYFTYIASCERVTFYISTLSMFSTPGTLIKLILLVYYIIYI